MRIPFLSLILGATVTMATSARGQPSPSAHELPAVPGTVITVTPAPGYQNEPSIAVNPQNPAQVFAAYQVPARVVFSRDGGRSWEHAKGVASKNYRVSGDVGATYAKGGLAVLCYIGFDKLGSENYWAHGATRNGVFIRRSLDGGATWEPEEHTVIAQPTKPGIPFEDKPGIAADTTHSPYAGNLYVGWTEFRRDESVILCSHSTDGGLHWSTPADISTHHGLPRDDNGAVEGFSAAVGANGTVFAVWADEGSIAFTASHDGGRSFTKSRSIIQTAPLYFAMAGLDRANGFPQIGMDSHDGKRGRLYVTWSDYRSGDVGVYCATSRNGGASWSKAVRVNTDPDHDGTDQFFQWLAVDPATGAANVIFYDRRDDPVSNRRTTVTLARSTDGGATFQNYAWTRVPFESTKEQFLGDYIGVAAFKDKVFGAWAEMVTAKPSSHKQDQKSVAPPRHGPPSIVRLGVADFSKAAPPGGSTGNK